MNPKNPQAAGGGFVLVPREPTEAIISAMLGPMPQLTRQWRQDGAHHLEVLPYSDHMKMAIAVYDAMLAAAPAIAPGGDALRLFDDLLYRLAGQIGDSNADFSHKIVSNYYRELDLIRKALAPAGDVRTPMTTDLPAAGNAGAVDDAMVERAKKAYCDWFGPIGEGVNTLALRAALAAALAPAAATPEHTFPGDTCKACHPELAAPADPPAAGDVNVVVSDLRRLGKEDGWLCATAGADMIEALLAAQEASRGHQ